MTELLLLFKLKKDGKTVGYMRLYGGPLGLSLRKEGDPDWQYDFFAPLRGCDADFIHPFVCRDRNGKDVFEGDRVNLHVGPEPRECTVEWGEAILGWNLREVNASMDFHGVPHHQTIVLIPHQIELIEEGP
jgi:hypothetical protein